jgi:peptidyl-tRNA hydrolase, PTH1 family
VSEHSAVLSPIQLIVGLGNPGAEYKDTRHNAGAWFVETLCQQFRLSLKSESKFIGQVGQWTFGGKEYRILIPSTFMNHSGQSVGAYAKYYNIAPQAILVAHDELDFEPGEVRFKTGGGHAGHNGLRDIIYHLHSRDFHRIRLGIGHPGHKSVVSDYVLSPASKEEKQKIRTAIQNTISTLQKTLIQTQ